MAQEAKGADLENIPHCFSLYKLDGTRYHSRLSAIGTGATMTDSFPIRAIEGGA